MSDLSDWQKGNDEYLTAALAWLRLMLELLDSEDVSPADPVVNVQPSPPPSAGGLDREDRTWISRIRGKSSPRPSSEHVKVAQPRSDIEERVAEAKASVKEAEKLDPPPALLILSQRFGLSRFERELLLLCAAPELDTRIPALCARAQRDPALNYPTLALAFTLLDEPAWDVISPERQLRYWKMLEIDQSSGQPMISSPLHLDQRILDYIKGLNYSDVRLAPMLSPLDVTPGETRLTPSQQRVADKIVSYMEQFSGSISLPVIQLLGPDKYSKQLIASHAAESLGLHLYRMPADLLPASAVDLDDLAILWERERFLLPVCLYLDAVEDGTGPEGHTASLNRFLARSHGVFFLDTREPLPGLARADAFDVMKPTTDEQEEAWAEALGEDAGESPGRLAGQFNLDLSMIRQIATNSFAERDDEHDLHDRLWKNCLVSTRPRLDVLAKRLDPKATWEEIVLSPTEINLLRQIAPQVRNRRKVYDEGGFRRRMNRGLGIGVLFAGESGTGKTMAAEVIANELQMNLYRIDLSQVVSKYIGETEKNLSRLFDAAEDGGAILFFDEAEALFGKRSEVKDSHDRYANIEINYLLQRMESFRGLAILATNMKSALDPAFVRRLRFIVDFPYPGPEERKNIWLKVFPPETRVEGLDYDRLAKLNLTGGSIHNIALNAAFLAAEAKTPVTMQLVLDAARTEFRKSEKPVIEGDFKA
ncbi:MAG TPA: ATP-binding protein [Methanothrix soehngenii]|nr:ATP-binding protein [Methanothrix soehngenii]